MLQNKRRLFSWKFFSRYVTNADPTLTGSTSIHENRKPRIYVPTCPERKGRKLKCVPTLVSGDFNAAGSVTPQKLTPSNNNADLPSDLPLTPQQPPTPPRPVVEPKAEVQEEMAPSQEDLLLPKHAEGVLLVSKGVVLNANVTSCDKVVVEGQFQGNIKAGTFVLTEGNSLQTCARRVGTSFNLQPIYRSSLCSLV